MHEETQRELIDGGTSLIGALCKEMIIHRNEIKKLEKERELQTELARVRREHQGDASTDNGSHTAHEEVAGVRAGGDLHDAIEDLKQREECSVCRDLLSAIQEADPRTQAIALTEYGKLTARVSDGASQQEIERLIRESDELRSLLQSHAGV